MNIIIVIKCHYHLLQFQAGTHDLVLLLLQRGLGLLQSRLQLVLLHLESPPLAVQLMDRLASLAELVQQVLDLVSKILVLSSDRLKILNTLIPCSLSE